MLGSLEIKWCDLLKIWFLTFESIYTRKIGGLAEVPPRLALELRKLKYDTWVLTPGHGVECSEESRIPYRLETNDAEYYFEECLFETPHILVKGGLFNESTVYPKHRLVEKALLFGRIVSSYYKFSLESGQTPVIVHGNDWHSVPALLGINALSVNYGVKTRFIYHIHLLTSTIIAMNDFIEYLNIYNDTWIRGFKGILSFREYYDLSKGFVDKLGSYISDKVITVSNSFVKNIVRNIGLEHSSRVDYVFNATTWDWSSVCKSIEKLFKVDPFELSSRDYVRKLLLTKYLSRINYSIEDSFLKKFVEETAGKYGVKYTDCFDKDGPLVFLSGRVSRQKGFDILIKALDKLITEIPDIRLILAVIPTHGSEELFKKLVETIVLYREHLRLIPGLVDGDYYRSLYYASTVYLALSRFEPFGLISLESMASGTPVVASRTGGFIDTVIDLRRDMERGNGLLIEPGSVDELVNGVRFMVDLMYYREDRELAARIRNNCIERSRFFNWSSSAKKLVSIYNSVTGV
uniref:Glycosyltransferase n=1 Tax=Staphylothermus marinus TaxID=2280 RepID=A0A7J3PLR0_STAMA